MLLLQLQPSPKRSNTVMLPGFGFDRSLFGRMPSARRVFSSLRVFGTCKAALLSSQVLDPTAGGDLSRRATTPTPCELVLAAIWKLLLHLRRDRFLGSKQHLQTHVGDPTRLFVGMGHGLEASPSHQQQIPRLAFVE